MIREIDVRTTVTVDLGDIPTRDLIDELEGRGHAVDESDLEAASVKELLDELFHRDYRQFAELDFADIIKALRYAGCPEEIVKPLEEWERQPMPTLQKLERWLALTH